MFPCIFLFRGCVLLRQTVSPHWWPTERRPTSFYSRFDNLEVSIAMNSLGKRVVYIVCRLEGVRSATTRSHTYFFKPSKLSRECFDSQPPLDNLLSILSNNVSGCKLARPTNDIPKRGVHQKSGRSLFIKLKPTRDDALKVSCCWRTKVYLLSYVLLEAKVGDKHRQRSLPI